MIVDVILEAVTAVLTWLIETIPSPFGYVPGLAGFMLSSPLLFLVGLSSSLSIWVPWGTIVGCFIGTWILRAGMATVALIIKLYAMIRGGAS